MQTPPLGDALFTATQQKVLGLLYGKPDQSFYANEIARWAKVGKGSLMRSAIDRLKDAHNPALAAWRMAATEVLLFLQAQRI